MTDVYGPLIGRDTLEQAFLNLFQTPPPGSHSPLIQHYLAAVERDRGLPPRSLPVPPGPSSYRGAVDFDTLTFQPEWFPCFIVGVDPDGLPERTDTAGEWGQWFAVQVAIVVADNDEDQARSLADMYGIAATALIAQHGSIGKTVNKTVPTGYPKPEYIDPDVRQVIRSTASFRCWVDTVLSENAGPLVYPPDPYAVPGDLPTVETVDITVRGVPVGAPLP
jgi:hypothetical protein